VFSTVFAALALAFLPIAQTYSFKYKLTLLAAISIYLSFLLLLGLALAPAFFSCRSRPMVMLCCAPYVSYAIGTSNLHWIALLKLVAVPLTLLLVYVAWPTKDLNRFIWRDLAAGAVLITIVLSGFLRGVWNVPVNLDFMNRLFLIAVAAWTWTNVRPVPGLGYDFRLSRRVLVSALLNFIYFAAIAIPLGLALHFTRWNPLFRGPLTFGAEFLEIFLFVALLEELFFRGFLQSLLTATWRDWRWAQLATSCLFGLFHILHAPFPNWRYVALATIAGWFYGSAFRKGGSVMASALMHAAVDTTWRTWFSAH
jgi:membrane protease YdiL (CAAX protease family)